MANFSEYVENVFLTQRSDTLKVSPMGGYYLDRIGREEIRPTAPSVTSIAYRRYIPIGNVGIIDSNTKDLPVLEAELRQENIPVIMLGGSITMTYDDFIGNIPDMEPSRYYGLRVETALKGIGLGSQYYAELGITNDDIQLVKGSLLNDDKILSKISPILFDENFTVETPEQIQAFFTFLTELTTAVAISSKATFYANQIVIPMSLMKVFTRPLSWFGSLKEQTPEDFLKGRGFDVIYSLNADEANGGTILALTKEEVDTIYTTPVEILLDQIERTGQKVKIPVRQGFAGAHFYQPLSAFKYINCLKMTPNELKQKSSLRVFSSKRKEEEKEKLEDLQARIQQLEKALQESSNQNKKDPKA